MLWIGGTLNVINVTGKRNFDNNFDFLLILKNLWVLFEKSFIKRVISSEVIADNKTYWLFGELLHDSILRRICRYFLIILFIFIYLNCTSYYYSTYTITTSVKGNFESWWETPCLVCAHMTLNWRLIHKKREISLRAIDFGNEPSCCFFSISIWGRLKFLIKKADTEQLVVL